MAAGERLGGLAPATRAAAQALAAAFDVVVIETVGVGQSETEVADAADTVAVVVQPGSGDVLQFLKSGIMEIPDVLVVTKADLGAIAPARAPRPARRAALARGARRRRSSPVSSRPAAAGIDELVDALDAHRAGLDLARARTRARRAGALADFVAEHGERGLRALGGRRAAQRSSPSRTPACRSRRCVARARGAGRGVSGEIPENRVVRAGTLAAVVGAEGAKLARAFARSGDARALALEAQHQQSARKLAEALGRMRGAAMKLGQLASFLDSDLLPEELRPIYQEELAKLRDQAPAFPWPQIRRVLEQEWEAPVERMLASIDERPAAAASIGQVHRATLPDGRAVAVKVQYPGVAAAVRADLGNARLLAHIGRILMPHLDSSALADELRDRITEELDYEYEAAMQRRFARGYRGHPFVLVPDVISSLSRERVLVSEWVDAEPYEAVARIPTTRRAGASARPSTASSSARSTTSGCSTPTRTPGTSCARRTAGWP